MSIQDLENFVSVLVRGSFYEPRTDFPKPIWWPDNLKFCYPVSNKCDIDSWKSTLLQLVTLCFQHSKLHKSENKEKVPYENNEVKTLSETKDNGNVIQENPPKYACTKSPIIVLEDICKTKLYAKKVRKATKEQYFRYLQLERISHKQNNKHFSNQEHTPSSLNIPLTPKLAAKLKKRKRNKCKKNKMEFKKKRKYVKVHRGRGSPKNKITTVSNINQPPQFNNQLKTTLANSKCFVALSKVINKQKFVSNKKTNAVDRSNSCRRYPLVLLTRFDQN